MQETTKLPLEEDQKTEGETPGAADATEPEAGAAKPEPPPAEPPQPERALVRLAADDQPVQPIIPRDEQEVARLARAIIASGIVPEAFTYQEDVDGKPAEDGARNIIHRKGEPNAALISMGILKAMELGLAPLTGLSYLLPINNRFTIWGDGAVALAQKNRLIANQTHVKVGQAIDPSTELANWPDEYGHEVRFWRVGQTEPYVGRYTVKDAKRAGLWLNVRKQPWIKYPDRMLYNRARAFALRDGFADALSGLAIAEEVRDMAPEPVDGGELRPQVSKSALVDDEED